ncbi:MAG: carboxypeptidase-like regulatory domain-containing protein [Flavobacteriaceae bacterium]|nr:carboxypeptidase-like regulatory domain-containing protein [Flavobacteriaceae bacterium]
MKPKLTYIRFLFLVTSFCFAQNTKVSGYVVDQNEDPIPFANVLFKDSTTGTITDENGKFYIETDGNYDTIIITFIGYETKEIKLEKRVTYNLNISIIEEAAALDEVVIYTGKQSKKNNPAIDILRKIWSRKRFNGVRQFDQYKYDKYEKIEFDLNTIDSALMKSKLFKGMEFVFEEIDTSKITGKSYLPIFINESFSEVYGDNKMNKRKEILQGNKNSGFSNSQSVSDFVKDLYSEYDVYDNYLKFFDKSFVSPLSRTGINTYNYVLIDSAFIDDKWCYNIVYYPRRKNELTFKGDFWVNDSTYAIKDINLQVSKSANINWVKDIYIEQEFEVLNDSVFLIKRDYFLSDFSLSKKDKARGMYGKRTTLYDNYDFNVPKDKKFYEEEVDPFREEIYSRDSAFWAKNRLEKLNSDEKGIYKMLDTLKTVPKFKRLYNLASILGSGYIEIPKLKMDYGPIYSTFGNNDVEGIRIRAGGRTYFSSNDKWRLQGYVAYGFRDQKVKYGISGKWLLNNNNRLIISGGNRRDVEQLGVSLTTINDNVLDRSFASSSIATVGSNNRLTSVNLSTLGLQMEPVKNLNFKLSATYRTLRSASKEFSIDYFDNGQVRSDLSQTEFTFSTVYQPGLKTTGHGVERLTVSSDNPVIFASYIQGVEGLFNSDFAYSKLQLFYRQPWQVGGFGVLYSNFEVGKTFGTVPLSLLNVVPGNQTFLSIFGTFPLLNFYEFVTDTYATINLQHNFNGRIFSRIPVLRDLNLRERVAFRAVMGSVSEDNRAMNASGIAYLTPNLKPYWEYSFGVGNIFKIFSVDFNFRGNYFDNPNARKFGITGRFGFMF